MVARKIRISTANRHGLALWCSSRSPWAAVRLPSYRRTLHANASIDFSSFNGGAVGQLGARLDGIEEVVGSNPIGSTKFLSGIPYTKQEKSGFAKTLLILRTWGAA